MIHNNGWIIAREVGGVFMPKTSLLVATALLLGSSLTIPKPADAEMVLQGEVCTQRVHELTNDIKWYSKLEEAQQAAADQHKLIFWMHILGKVDGAT